MPPADMDALVAANPVFRKLSAADRQLVVEAAVLEHYQKGAKIFEQGTPADRFYTIATGRVKIFKMLASGRDVILEVFGVGDPLGAVATYEERPFPASATALEPTDCIVIPRAAFFRLLEQNPTLVRGLLSGLTTRLVELTNRIAELSGSRIEPRLARVLLKLVKDTGRQERGGIFIPLALSRQELADMTGTTIETSIRIMSRWGKQKILRTEKDGFVILDPAALEAAAVD
jgi:CRP-like cAMP-binding protein